MDDLTRVQGFGSMRAKAAFLLAGMQGSGCSSIHITGLRSGWIYLKDRSSNEDLNVQRVISGFCDESINMVCAMGDMYFSPSVPDDDFF